jgi:hypothetical protein
MVCRDWVKLLLKLNMSYRDVNIIESMYPTNIQNQALEGLERWKRRNMEGNVSLDDMVQNLITALEEVNRHDVTEIIDGIIGSIISMLATSAVDRGFEPLVVSNQRL